MLGQLERFEDNCSNLDLEWLTDSPPENQLKHLRASVQGSSWMWDKYYDPYQYCLAGETYTKKIY